MSLFEKKNFFFNWTSIEFMYRSSTKYCHQKNESNRRRKKNFETFELICTNDSNESRTIFINNEKRRSNFIRKNDNTLEETMNFLSLRYFSQVCTRNLVMTSKMKVSVLQGFITPIRVFFFFYIR